MATLKLLVVSALIEACRELSHVDSGLIAKRHGQAESTQPHEAQAQVTSGHHSRQSIQILIDGCRQIESNLKV